VRRVQQVNTGFARSRGIKPRARFISYLHWTREGVMAARQFRRPTMKDSQDTFKKIAEELAAIERELPQLRDKLCTLETRQKDLRITQSVLLGFQSEETHRPEESFSRRSKERNGESTSRFFQSEGQTTTLVRYLYAKGTGSTVVEAARHTGISTRRTRTAFDRLESRGLMIRSEKIYALTPKGIAEWQNSPLFRKEAASA
jgi:hypothetical protein